MMKQNLDPISPTPRYSKSVDLTQRYPLTLDQQKLWDESQRCSFHDLYHVNFVFDVKGPLNVDQLRRSIQAVIDRQPTLRTRFFQDNNKIEQAWPSASSGQITYEIRSAPSLEEEQHFLGQLLAQPFDFTCQSPFRVHLVQWSPQRHSVLLVWHHLVTDFQSMIVTVSDIFLYYRDGHLVFNTSNAHFIDHLVDQHQELHGPDAENKLTYWKEHLNGVHEFSGLPPDLPVPNRFSFRGAGHRIELNSRLTQRLDTFSTEHGFRPFVVMMAAYALTIMHWSEHSETVIGCPVSKRRMSADGFPYGFMAGFLPFRIETQSSRRLVDLLTKIRSLLWQHLRQRQYPGAHLPRQLEIPTSTKHHPLFQAALVYDDLGKMNELPFWNCFNNGKIILEDLEIDSSSLPRAGTWVDLMLFIARSDNFLSITLRYVDDLYSKTLMEAFGQTFVEMIDAIVHSPRHLLPARVRAKAMEKSIHPTSVSNSMGSSALVGPGSANLAGLSTLLSTSTDDVRGDRR